VRIAIQTSNFPGLLNEDLFSKENPDLANCVGPSRGVVK
jgi:hypothetical protein